MSDLVFRRATADDDPRILELFRSSFGREMSVNWWKWFSYECPTGLNRTSVIEDRELGNLASSYSLLPIRLRLNDREIKASLGNNVNTRADYQRRGLFYRLGQFALARERESDARISLAMPNDPRSYHGSLKTGWNVAWRLPFLVKQKCQLRSHRCRQVKQFDKRFDDFYTKISRNYSFIVLKDYKFMNWRVVSRPDTEYAKFVCEEGSRLRGYVVLKHFDEMNYPRTHILDIQAETDDVLDELIAAAESFAHGRHELNMWTNPRNPYNQRFLDQGFYQRDSPDALIIHFNYGKEESVQDGPCWCCLADNDVY